MNKLISSVLIATTILTSTPAMARDRHNRSDRYEHRHERRDRGSNAGNIILGIIGGAIIVSALANSERDREQDDDRYYDDFDPYADDRYTMPRRPRYYEHYCVTEQQVDRRGRVYYRRICQ